MPIPKGFRYLSKSALGFVPTKKELNDYNKFIIKNINFKISTFSRRFPRLVSYQLPVAFERIYAIFGRRRTCSILHVKAASSNIFCAIFPMATVNDHLVISRDHILVVLHDGLIQVL